MQKIVIEGSTAWSHWLDDGTIGRQSKGHYLHFVDDDYGITTEVALCGVALPDTFDAEFEGGAYVDCKRCQKKHDMLSLINRGIGK